MSSLNTASSVPLIERVSILAVIVLFRVQLEQCVSFQSLMQSEAEAAHPGLDLTVLVVDNSPETLQHQGDLPANVSLLQVPENLGLANAYNQGIRRAERAGITWLLTLDQDTHVPRTFVDGMVAHVRSIQHDAGIAAVVPYIREGSTPVSPYVNRWGAYPTWFASGYVGVPRQEVFAINSASLLRVDALVQAGGYDPLFWLDCSDMAMFRRLHRFGKRVFVAGDIEVQHQLSVKDMQHRLSAKRYRHMLLAESAFWDAEMGVLSGFERTGRLALRLFRQIRRREEPALLSITGKALARRLFRSARYRRRLFLQDVEDHLGSHLAETALPRRAAKVSVCMASYNSGHYIDLQLRSVLDQLGEQDEVIVVDDNSSDGTPHRVRGIADPRIRVIEQTENAGLVRSFEHALRSATGDLLFLCDHDDIWAPDKVRLFTEAFNEGPNIQLVMSAVTLIDADNVPFTDRRWDRAGKFRRGFFRNILKNSYQGSALAIRSDMLESLLPFPEDRAYFHDAWIGTQNDRLRGGMVFLPEPLLLYRRHATNLSQRVPWGRRVLSRSQLLLDHFRHALATWRPRNFRR